MPSRWWDGDPDELFWMEITDRHDLGLDLNAPAVAESGAAYWSYDLIREVAEGDVVFHYRSRPTNAITHWSRATGEAYADEVFWGAHGQAGGRGPVDPYLRAGWRRPLDGPYALSRPVTAADLGLRREELVSAMDAVAALHPGQRTYKPFVNYGGRELRAYQGYLTKLPQAVVTLVPELAEAAELATRTRPTSFTPAPEVARAELGTDYRPVSVRPTTRRQPFSVDPDLVDRALNAHARTQEALAAAVRAAGKLPRSPVPGEPVFEIAWEHADAICVAEVKSMSGTNDEKQLRLALGQVLRYAHLLKAKGRPVRCFIAGEHEPLDPTWIELCADLGVVLIWPDIFHAAVGSD